ncbi:MAG: YceI family protein [Chitinophagales bacterium]|nr:YceI family protein [Chitinophagales bacterium]
MQKLWFFLIAAVLMTSAVAAQNAPKYLTRDGKLKFDATATSSPEKIEALSNSATCVLDAGTGEMAWQVLLKGFKFEKALMQEHFNENYVESDKFPKATFKGRITNLSEVNLSKDGTYNAVVTGKMSLHGVEKDITANGAVTVSGGKIRINAGFSLLLSDYNISIPSVVSQNIAKEAKILIDATLEPKQ